MLDYLICKRLIHLFEIYVAVPTNPPRTDHRREREEQRQRCIPVSLQSDEMRVTGDHNLTISDLNSTQEQNHDGSSPDGVFIFVLTFNVCYCLMSNLLITLTKAFLKSIPPGRKLVMRML